MGLYRDLVHCVLVLFMTTSFNLFMLSNHYIIRCSTWVFIYSDNSANEDNSFQNHIR